VNVTLAFDQWVVHETVVNPQAFERLRLAAAFDVYVSRLEQARLRGADEPLLTISSHGAGGNSRACTRRMLAKLGYTAAELRVVHRLMAGSASGWPGFIRLYAKGSTLSGIQREYVRRQLHLLSRRSEPTAAAARALDASSTL
jgi:hypothetical protein